MNQTYVVLAAALATIVSLGVTSLVQQALSQTVDSDDSEDLIQKRVTETEVANTVSCDLGNSPESDTGNSPESDTDDSNICRQNGKAKVSLTPNR